jgi:hypothetical protein
MERGLPDLGEGVEAATLAAASRVVVQHLRARTGAK